MAWTALMPPPPRVGIAWAKSRCERDECVAVWPMSGIVGIAQVGPCSSLDLLGLQLHFQLSVEIFQVPEFKSQHGNPVNE